MLALVTQTGICQPIYQGFNRECPFTDSPFFGETRRTPGPCWARIRIRGPTSGQPVFRPVPRHKPRRGMVFKSRRKFVRPAAFTYGPIQARKLRVWPTHATLDFRSARSLRHHPRESIFRFGPEAIQLR